MRRLSLSFIILVCGLFVVSPTAQHVGLIGRGIPQQGAGGGGGGSVPGAPLNLSVQQAGDTDLSVAWDRADDTDTSIVLERAPDSAGSPGAFVAMTALETHANVYEDSSLDPSTKYWYQVKAVNGSGASSYSSSVSATTSAFAGSSTPTITTLTATVNSAWRITLTWTDPADQPGSSPRYIIERSSDGVSYQPITSPYCLGAGLAETFIDYPLSVNSTYRYRIRKVNNTTYGPYTYSASVTTSTLGSSPNIPSAVVATVNSATATTITWTDASSGAATYQIETATMPGDGFLLDASFSQIAETVAGATSYALSTTANTPIFARVRAHQSGLESEYAKPFIVRPASTGTGGTTYDIGPGQARTHIADLDWTTLGPGDTVNIHYATYPEKLAITRRGTAAAPITVNCLPDGSGNKPIITGLSATTGSQFAISHTFEDLAVLHVGKLSGDPTSHEAGYVTINGCDIENAYQGNSPNTYTRADGSTGTYIEGVACIYFGRGDHITLHNNDIHGCSNGVFGAAGEDETRALSDIVFDGNYNHGNGTVGGFSEHASYMEGQRITYQFNHYGPLRSGAFGAGIKDRSSGVVVRYNYLEGGTVRLELPESQNAFYVSYVDPADHVSYVYGNVLSTTDADVTGFLVDYSGDSGLPWEYRKGTLYAAYNTFVVRYQQSTQFRVIYFRLRDDPSTQLAGTFDVRDNVGVDLADSGTNPESYLVEKDGRVWLGKNWFSPYNGDVRVAGGTGVVTGQGNLLSAVGNAPSFTSITTGDYRPSSSPFTGQTPTPLPGSFPSTINLEYVMHVQSQARAALTTLGYYQ